GIDDLIQHEWMIAVPAHGETLLVAGTRLLDVDIDVAHRADDTEGVVHQPPGVGIGDEPVAGLQLRRDRLDPGDVDFGIAADLELEAAITLGAIAGDAA